MDFEQRCAFEQKMNEKVWKKLDKEKRTKDLVKLVVAGILWGVIVFKK